MTLAFVMYSGCGTNPSSTNSGLAANGVAANGACPAGYAYSVTYAQCLQQSPSCAGTNAIYNGYCVNAGVNALATNSAIPINGVCQPGMVATAQGCYPQGPCNAGYAYYNGLCYRTVQ